MGVSRPTWRLHLQTFGIDPNHMPSLTWQQLRHLLVLQLYLKAGNGLHSKADVAQVYRNGGMKRLEAELKRLYRIDVDTEFECLIEAYKKSLLGKTRRSFQPLSCLALISAHPTHE